jgi:hypothetical protein
MRLRNILGLGTLFAFVISLSIGCGEGTDVKVTKAPEPTAAPAGVPLPKEVKKGGGAASSGNMKRDPGASN